MTEALQSTSAFDDRIATREARIGIVGLGYAGLPLAMAFGEAGFPVPRVDLKGQRAPGGRSERAAGPGGARAALVPGRRAGRAVRPARRPAASHHRLRGGIRARR